MKRPFSMKRFAVRACRIHKQRGIGILELSVAAILGSIVTIIAIAVVPKYLSQRKVESEMQALQVVLGSLYDVTRGERDWSGVTPARIYHEKILNPSDYQVNSTFAPNYVFRNRWGGEFFFFPYMTTKPNDSLAIVLTGLPDLACRELAMLGAGHAFRVYGNGVTLKNKSAGLNISAASVSNACNKEKSAGSFASSEMAHTLNQLQFSVSR